MIPLKHWQKEIDSEEIIWLGFNRENASVNTINHEVLDEFNHILHEIAHLKSARGLVIYSLKAKGFIAGADVTAFAHLTEPNLVAEFLRKGQKVFARLAALTIPTVAMIDGFCMGGGLELALACDYRVATQAQDTRFGLPEVRLGIHPGWGGTVRLPALIGGFNALSMLILSGASVSASTAKKLGLVDVVVPLRQLKRAAISLVTQPSKPRKKGLLHYVESYSGYRRIMAKFLRKQLKKRIDEHYYPAPFQALSLWENNLGTSERAYLKEAESVASLIFNGTTATNLTQLFLERERMKASAKKSTFKALHVHVIGAGVMGGDIAAWCALRGLSVTLQDQTYSQIAPAIGRAAKLFKKQLRQPYEIQAAMDRLIPDPDGHGLSRAGVIIEAVFENLEIKRTLMAKIESIASPEAILATNTSSIALDEINTVMLNPERLVGIHFFNPVAQMDLIEIVQGEKTAEEIIYNACAFVNQIGKLPLIVQSKPGFLINRVLMPYLMEAIVLLDEGYSGEQIDAAAKQFGMMMGPVTLMDKVGLDVCLAVAKQLVASFGGKVPTRLFDLVAQGHLGCKSGQGFYVYKHGKPIKNSVKKLKPDPTIAVRLIAKMVEEAQVCMQDKIVEDARLLDAGMVFATGFAPFRGGPLQYAEGLTQMTNS